MKQYIIWGIMLLIGLTAQAEAPDIIYSQPEGLLRIYIRQGLQLKENEEEGGTLVSTQEGNMSVVFADDNVVYLQDPVSGYTMSGTWVRGTLNAEGTKITVPLGQYVDYTRSFDMAYQLQLLNYDAEEDTYVWDETATEVTYTLAADGSISLDGTSREHPLGLIFRTFGNPQGASMGQDFMYLNYLWIGVADFASAYTLLEVQAQQPPTGMEHQARYATSAEYDGASYSPYNAVARVGRDGDDVWIQGISRLLPSAWVKGTVRGEKIVFPTGQFMGTVEGIPIFLHGAVLNDDNSFSIKDIEFEADGNDYITYDYVFVTTSVNSLQYVQFYMGLTLSAQPDAVVEAPGLPTLSYTFSHQEGSSPANVALTADDIYVQGIWDGLPEAWIKGSHSGQTATFASPQFLGIYNDEDGDFPIYFMAYDPQTGHPLRQLTFAYDPQTGNLTSASAPVSIGINKTGYLSVQDYVNPVLINNNPDAIPAIRQPGQSTARHYDLSGRRIAPVQRGLHIVGGRKIAVP